MSEQSRDSGLDAARGLLMLLGVIIHTANVYTPSSRWLVTDPQTHPFFGLLAEGIHVFRMPAFFWIAGYFSAMALQRHGEAAIWRVRVPRLLIPLLTTAFLLNTTQDLVLSWILNGALGEVTLGWPPVYHLWFLIDLLVFTCVAAWLGPWLALRSKAWRSRAWPHGLVVVVVCAVLATMVLIVARLVPHVYTSWWGTTSLYRLATYLPYFAAGFLMFHLPELKARFLGVSWAWFMPALFVAMTLGAVAKSSASPFVAEVLQLGVHAATWLSVGALLSIFALIFRQPSALTHALSDSAYSVYLLHHGIVVLLAALLVSWPLGLWLKFALVAGVSAATAFVLHIGLIRRHPWLRFLLNGK